MRGSTQPSRFSPVLVGGTAAFLVAVWAVGGGGTSSLAQMQQEMKPGMQMPQGMKHEMKMETATEGIFEGVGEVKALLPEKGQIVVGHEEIKGFMEAMPMGMGYAVESKDLLKGLKPGDRVKFKIDAANKTIVAIERLEEKKGSSY